MGEYLVVFGLVWIAVNSLLALRIGMQHESHVDGLEVLIREGSYEEYEKKRSKWQWKKAVHAHGMLLALVAVAVGLVVPRMTSSSGSFINIMGALLICAPILWTVFGRWFVKPLLALGDLCFVSGIVMGCLALLKPHF
jgi:hypothetical protein